MNFAVKLDELRRRPFLYVQGEPKEIEVGGKRYQVLVAYDPAMEAVRVELRPATKEKENQHEKNT